ncbi:MAG: hypothetical protein ACI32E_06565 [Bacilli bacterium]
MHKNKKQFDMGIDYELTKEEIEENKKIMLLYGAPYVEKDEHNLFINAYDEMMREQYEEAEHHFSMYLLEHPIDWKSSFLKAYCKCHHGKFEEIVSKCEYFYYEFKKSFKRIIKIKNKSERDASINVILKFLGNQYSFFVNNIAHIENNYETVSIDDIKYAPDEMLNKCIKIVKKYSRLSNYHLKQLNALQLVEKNNKRILLLFFIVTFMIGILFLMIR